MARAGDQHVVLNSHSAPPRHINAWLDGNDHSRPQLGFLPDGQAGRFVNLQSGAVPQTVAKRFAEARSRDDLSRDVINLFARSAGPNRVDRRELRFEHNSIYLTQFGRNFTCHNDSRQVAHVEPGVDSPVDQREIALAQPSIRGRRVRQRRASPTATIAGKLSAFAPKRRAWYSKSAATSSSVMFAVKLARTTSNARRAC